MDRKNAIGIVFAALMLFSIIAPAFAALATADAGSANAQAIEIQVAPVIKYINTEQSPKQGGLTTTIAKVAVVDSNGNPVKDATVALGVTMPKGEKITGAYAGYQNGEYSFEITIPTQYSGMDVSATASAVAARNGVSSSLSSIVKIYGSTGAGTANGIKTPATAPSTANNGNAAKEPATAPTEQPALVISYAWSTKSDSGNYIYAKVTDQNGNLVKEAAVTGTVSYGGSAVQVKMAPEGYYYMATLPLLEQDTQAKVSLGASAAGYISASYATSVMLYGKPQAQQADDKLTIADIFTSKDRIMAKILNPGGQAAVGANAKVSVDYQGRNLLSGYMQYNKQTGYFEYPTSGLVQSDIIATAYVSAYLGNHSADMKKDVLIYGSGAAEQPKAYISALWSDKDGVHAKALKSDGSPATPDDGYSIQVAISPPAVASSAGSAGTAAQTQSASGYMQYNPQTGYYDFKTDGIVAKDTQMGVDASLYQNGQYVTQMSRVLTIYASGATVTSSGEALGYAAYWYGKVDQHSSDGKTWQTDPDGVSGADIYPLDYCQKWFPSATGVNDMGLVSITGWKNAGNVDSFDGNGVLYECNAGGSVNLATPLIEGGNGFPAWRHLGGAVEPTSQLKIADIWADDQASNTNFVWAKITTSDGVPLTDLEGGKAVLQMQLQDGSNSSGTGTAVGMAYDPSRGYWEYNAGGMFSQPTKVEATVDAYLDSQKTSMTKYVTVYGTGGDIIPQPPSTHVLALHSGWNMISAPDDGLTMDLIQKSCTVRSKAWNYDGNQYQAAASLEAGKGYWIKVASDCQVETSGNNFDVAEVKLHAGWNQFGTPNGNTPIDAAASTCTVTGGPWQYDAQAAQYRKQAALGSFAPQAGAGYWLKVSGDCVIAFGNSGMPPAPPEENNAVAAQQSASATANGVAAQQPASTAAAAVYDPLRNSKGPSDAKVAIVEFSDFECPFCAGADAVTGPIIAQHPNDIKFVYRQFPLIGAHPYAEKAAEASECAGEQGKFWEMHDKLFANQNTLYVANMKEYAKEIGMDMGKFDSCLDSGRMAGVVNFDLEGGKKLGVKGTPTFFINGQMVAGADAAGINAAVEKALAS